MADIERMFHQFKEAPEHLDYLLFIWYDTEGRPATYNMTVYLFGTRSSPACATYALRYLADKLKGISPHNSPPYHYVHQNSYVDDGLTSVYSATETVDRLEQTKSLCAAGRLRLHEVASNSRAFISKLLRSECYISLADSDITSEPLPSERSPKVVWDTELRIQFRRSQQT